MQLPYVRTLAGYGQQEIPYMKRSFVAIGAMLCVTVITATAQADMIDDPFNYFNVYSLGDIGSEASPYHSDFQGRAGAAGNVAFSSFSLLNQPNQTGPALHVGGSARLTGAYLGDVEAGGDIALGGVGISGNVTAGGYIVQFGGGSVGGNAHAGLGVALNETLTVYGDTQTGMQYAPTTDHQAISDYFRNTSADIGAMSATGSYTEEWGHLTFTGTEGVNVVNIAAEDLQAAWKFTIDAPTDAIVYVNVPDTDVTLDWTAWNYEGGILAEDVLLNMSNAEYLELSSTNAVNILAPLAATDFDSGLIAGTLIVGDLQGGGQVNNGSFGHGGSIPEPASILLLAGGTWAALLRRRRPGPSQR